MRHRAPRSFLSRIPVPDPARRRVVAAAVLAMTAALTGVGVAVQRGDPEPSAAGTPIRADLGTPSSATPPTLTDSPSKAVSRGGDRKPVKVEPSASPVPSPTESATTSALPEPTETPDVGTATAASKAPTSSAPSPVDEAAPDTSASTSAVDSDSWTVAVSSDEPASYECSLDGGSYQACSSSTTFSDLDRGRHSLTARATDEAGNTDPSPAELTTTVNRSD
jgi:large repetitive protein